jgi:hypothetical protein
LLFAEQRPAVPLSAGERAISSELIEIEACWTVDRGRLLGNLDHRQTTVKRKELRSW